jgi:hypothetical protein
MPLKPVDIRLTIHIPATLEKLLMSLALAYHRLRYGHSVRLIPVGRGKYAIVDADDYDRLAKYKWQVHYDGNTYYAFRRTSGGAGKKRRRILMHREIMDIPEGLVCDHINRKALDNRKANLRPATSSQNNCNTRKRGQATSRYRGVGRATTSNKWVAQIKVNGRQIYLGTFDNKVDAAKAYDAAAKKYHGEFAVLNFPDRTPSWPRLLAGRLFAIISEKCAKAFESCRKVLKSTRKCAKTEPGASREINVSICRVLGKIGQNSAKVRETCEKLTEIAQKCTIMNTLQMARGP